MFELFDEPARLSLPPRAPLPATTSDAAVSAFTRAVVQGMESESLLAGLEGAGKNTEHDRFAPVIAEILHLVRSEGIALSEALTEQEGAFSQTYIAFVRAGEFGGFMSPVLKRLADAPRLSTVERPVELCEEDFAWLTGKLLHLGVPMARALEITGEALQADSTLHEACVYLSRCIAETPAEEENFPNQIAMMRAFTGRFADAIQGLSGQALAEALIAYGAEPPPEGVR